MKKIIIAACFAVITPLFLSGCQQQLGCRSAEGEDPCTDEWTAFHYPEGNSGAGDVKCEIQENFSSKSECEAWATEKNNDNNIAEYDCGRGCTYSKNCEYACREMKQPVAAGISNFHECEKTGGEISETLNHRDCKSQDGQKFIEGLDDQSKEFSLDKQKWSLMKELHQGAEDFYKRNNQYPKDIAEYKNYMELPENFETELETDFEYFVSADSKGKESECFEISTRYESEYYKKYHDENGKFSVGNLDKKLCSKQNYQEFITQFSEGIGAWDSGINQDEEIEKFIKNTGEEKFWSSNQDIYNQNKKDLKNNSGATQKIPDGYTNYWNNSYIDDNSQYDLFMDPSSEKIFLFINEQKTEIGKVVDGADGGIKNVSFINDNFSFLYRKKDSSEEEFHWEYFYDEPNFSQKVGVDAVSKIFEYDGKIGFVGQKNGKWAIYFDKQKISEDFDEIRTTACCAIRTFPFEIYENGTIFFMGRRGEKYILAESRL